MRRDFGLKAADAPAKDDARRAGAPGDEDLVMVAFVQADGELGFFVVGFCLEFDARRGANYEVTLTSPEPRRGCDVVEPIGGAAQAQVARPFVEGVELGMGISEVVPEEREL